MKKILTTKSMLLILGVVILFVVALFLPVIHLHIFSAFKLAEIIPGAGVDISASIKNLKEERSGLFEKMEAIHSLAVKEKRSRSEQEIKDWDEHDKRINAIDKELRDLERLLENRQKAAKEKGVSIGNPETRGDDMAKVSRLYSLSKALREVRTSGKLTGVEKEMDEEGLKEARTEYMGDKSNMPNFNIPSRLFAIGGKQERALTITTEGTDIMQTQLAQQVIPILAPKPIVEALGAQTLTGLTGDFQLPRHSGAASMTWQGETVALTATTPTLDNTKLSPKSLGGYIEISDQSLVQANFGLEQWVRNELNRAFALKLDLAALSGDGSGSTPTGVAHTASISSVVFGAPDGGAPAWAKILEFISDIEADDADMGALAFLTTPQAKAKLLSTPREAGGVEGNFILDPRNPNELVGYKFAISNQAAHDLDKGASSGILSEMFFGNWNDVMIGQFGAINLLVNPYLKSRERLVSIEISGLFDVKLRHPESFAYAADMITT